MPGNVSLLNISSGSFGAPLNLVTEVFYILIKRRRISMGTLFILHHFTDLIQAADSAYINMSDFLGIWCERLLRVEAVSQ